MGFFSDLKEDLSQAVGDMKPANDQAAVEDEKLFDEKDGGLESDFNEDALSDLLDKLDEEDVAESSEATSDIPEFTVPEPTPVPEFSMPEVAPFVAPNPVSDAAASAMTSSKVASDEVSCIMESMIINGNIATEGSLELRGCVVGNVEALGKLNITGSIEGNSSAAEVYCEGAKISGEVKSMGSIKIGQSTTIIGNVSATSAVVAGAVKGDIDVRGPVILDSTAIVLGNIRSKAVQINNGAVIEGNCSQCYAEVNPTSFFEELKKMK